MKKKKWLPFAIIGGVLFSGLLIAVIIILWSSVFHFAGIVVNSQKEVGNSGQEVLQSQLATGQENTSEPLSGEGDSPESGNKNGRTNIYLGYIFSENSFRLEWNKYRICFNRFIWSIRWFYIVKYKN